MNVLKPKYDLIVIGGGPAGLSGALSGALESKTPLRIGLIDQGKQAGRKILASGNGRCNLGNENPSVNNYHSQNQPCLAKTLNQFPFDYSFDFFNEMGIALKADPEGRYYPVSEEAAAVQRTLTRKVKDFGIDFWPEREIVQVKVLEDGYLIKDHLGNTWSSHSLILCPGSPAGSELNSSSFAQELAKQLNLEFNPFRPGLSQILIREKAFLKRAQGARFKGAVNSDDLPELKGEFLFNQNALSGIASMDVSNYLSRRKGKWSKDTEDYLFDQRVTIYLDFFPDLSEQELASSLSEKVNRQTEEPEIDLSWLLDTYIHSRLIKAMLVDFTIDKKMSSLNLRHKAAMKELARLLKAYPLNALGIRSYKFAQVATGGISLTELNPDFSVKKYPGLFIAGEALDLTGNCGGYNLHFAFASGILAGKSASKYLLDFKQ